ncbi:MAG: methionine synthase [Cyanobacteria bacterium]|nr:methionine synthase [Cyanobacteriota bacterium]
MPNNTFRSQLLEKIILFDGGMGTQIQQHSLTLDDFAGLDGCNEYLLKTRPEVIKSIHANYFQAGADVVETNSFGSTSVVLAEYDIADQDYELNFLAAKLAKEVALDFSKDTQRFVAGSIGPTTKLPTLGHIRYQDLKKAYVRQVQGLIDGGVDVLLIETCQDLLQVKAALAAVNSVKQSMGLDIPVMVQVTIEATGTMLVGMDIATVVATLEPYSIDVLGMNCATGPQEMSGHIRYLSLNSPFHISCLPNAGMPENVGGKAHYHLSPEGLGEFMSHFVKDFGVNIIGGCCGTTPAHIKVLSETVGNLSPVIRTPNYQNSLTSLYSASAMKVDPAPVLIGERTNANGSRKFCQLLAEEDYDGLVSIAKSQAKEGAHFLDVCTAYVGRDEVRDMRETITRFNSQLDLPLMIDSTEYPVIEEALSLIAGKAIVNSINLEDGEERLAHVLPLCKEFGAAVVALTIDEDGMAKTAQKKFEIAERILDLAVNKYGISKKDIVFDTLTFTLGSGDEEFRKAGIETIEAIRLIKAKHPEVGTVLGISNISFGLKSTARHVINSVFLHYAVEAGLDMAIINSKHIMPLHRISETERELCRKLIFDERHEGFDPLTELMAYYDAHDASSKKQERDNSIPTALEDRLKYRIINGEKAGMENDLTQALETYSALDIINTILLDGMKTVGELFGRGEMQLPFVLQSAEVMKHAVAFLEPFMEKVEGGNAKGIIVLATVKGDVHDIGKNLVDIILTNNGYKVINLGIKQSIEAIIQATLEHKAHAVGMSGLLVKSTAIMKENLAVMKERGISVPVLLGGAALTPKFVTQDCQAEYDGKVFYSKDAFAGLNAMEEVMGFVSAPSTQTQTVSVGAALKEESVYQEVGEVLNTGSTPTSKDSGTPKIWKRSETAENVPIPTPPFYGTKVVADISLEEVFPYMNTQAIVAGQWQVKRGTRSGEEYQAFLEEKIYPILEALKKQVVAEKLLQPKVIYGFFPCQSQQDDLIIYHPEIYTNEQKTEELTRFHFPRGGVKNLCISDYFASVDSGRVDVIGTQIVTVGREASNYTQTLFEAGKYTEYLYLHGFSVEMAEALAEYWHKKIREEWGIAGQDAPEIKKLFAQGYQGSRFSFGYPACPNLEDQTHIMKLLDPSRIGIELSEEFMLEPEQSTSAIIIHHPEARYFDVRN